MSSIRKRSGHMLPAFSLPRTDTAAAAAVGVVADTAALEGAAAADTAAEAAEAALGGAAAAEVAATVAAEAAVSGLDLSRSASEPQFASRRNANLVNATILSADARRRFGSNSLTAIYNTAATEHITMFERLRTRASIIGEPSTRAEVFSSQA
jgi:hypothetical protein